MGILSWPNTSAEKIFLLKNDEQANKKVSIEVNKASTINHTISNADPNLVISEDSAIDQSNENRFQQYLNYNSKEDNSQSLKKPKGNNGDNCQPMTTEILTITHDIHNP